MPLKELAERRTLLHRKSDAQTIIAHALDDQAIGPVAMVSSFGADSVVLLHMLAQVDKGAPVLFVDTEFLFPATLTYQRDVAEHLGLTDIRVIKPSRAALLERDVDGILHHFDPDACCALRKTEPLERALEGFGGWITGRKRIHGGARQSLPLYEKNARRIKINPLADWTQTMVSDYIASHDLPRHPMVAQGFPSIGCQPCTTPAKDDEDPRAGRWRGQQKTECGIHFIDGVPQRRAS
ncbi:phosphoadenylyl-sulfate reductase [Gymnodinialimonas ceratoperidinii]|uniref:Adenosine 5'-phosphosulfate reductase n=1 Tax=Gymnodinialimonas ceratoperidinii TaxID=2856823 RepID=A0A8F6Y9C2_9RHOB|nr:phosphoadenylyl-sulfate reductase [Gymnodinialimonas ceratoperidinii]QXT38799.1 phosphoadenylyl-sulfate reductase [Gymnodinialimonas ceratoperidinii]